MTQKSDSWCKKMVILNIISTWSAIRLFVKKSEWDSTKNPLKKHKANAITNKCNLWPLTIVNSCLNSKLYPENRIDAPPGLKYIVLRRRNIYTLIALISYLFLCRWSCRYCGCWEWIYLIRMLRKEKFLSYRNTEIWH